MINAGQAQALVMVDELVRCGMTDACLAPGSRSTPMALALARRPEIRLHVSIDERSASFLALGIAKQSRHPAAVLTTSGTAAANLYPAVMEAHHACVPLILLTADRPPELRDTGAGQTMDQIKLYGNAVRWFVEVGVAEDREDSVAYWRSVACRAYHTSGSPRPGPVHLNLAFRQPFVAAEDEPAFSYDLGGRADGSAWSALTTASRELSGQSLSRLKEEIDRTERGLVVVGTGDHDSEPILSVAQAAGWPLIAEATSNARVGPLAISTYDSLLRAEDFASSHRPDLVLRIGSLGTSAALNGFLDASVRQIAIHPQDTWPDPRRAISWMIRSEVGPLCRALAAELAPDRRGSWMDEWQSAEATARSVIDGVLDEHEEVSEPRVARDLACALPEHSNLVVASSMPIRDLDWFMRPRQGLRLLANRGVNGIDGFVSTALGVALAAESPTAALCGDLALLHDQNGLLLASERRPDVVFVVVNNNGGGIFSFLPQASEAEFERLFVTPHNVDLSMVARTYGCGYRLMDKASDLGPALTDALQIGGVQIIEARTNRDSNVELHRAIWLAVGEALRESGN
ncbi:MAG TPA: 2-succinyl-5-enolpyruvyl-6-hydroxy-3-cyclohexene-1-carboxylic-acid synthase [Actinomycetota bacterium]|nr:2-succinyl-5-enolpyruvyl-6-hydroxy-3-cyclohexene-1-carboxylic-acid synthase [Actinomycetota bacterium]